MSAERAELAAQLLNAPDAEVILAGVGSALLACERQLDRIAIALEAGAREPSYLPPRQAPPEPEVVAGGNFGVDPETRGEAAMACGTPLYRPEPPRGSEEDRVIEALCFLEPGHHGSHRSEKGHIWS